MKDKGNIEQLFKDTFEHFEADVNPTIWTNVQNGIGSSASGTASIFAKLAIGKIAAGVVIVAAVAGGIWYVSSDSHDKKNQSPSTNNQSQPTSVSTEAAQTIISESRPGNDLSNSQANKQTASVNSPALQNAATISHEEISGSTTSENQISENHTASENQSTIQSVHKYGNAPQGDGGLIRGNKSGDHSSSSNTSDSNEEEASLPTANIFVSTTSGDAPLTVDFINQGVASSLIWDFGDSTISREGTPSHTFKKAGIYQVTLTAKNGTGSASDKKTIEVKATSYIADIPNIFTPNADGKNDMFFFELNDISSLGVVIFNQKNGIVAQWNTLDGGWNGKLLNGEDAPNGVYFYTIQAIGKDGIPHSEKGSVTLNRH